MIKQRYQLELGEAKLAYSLYRRSDSLAHSSNKILLLHGAGVAGELTWTFIANYLEHWDEILIPDLLGMGESYFDRDDELSFSIEDISQSLFSLLRHLQWSDFDLVGYSLGGLVALELNHEASNDYINDQQKEFNITKLGLIEPALFSDQSLQAAISFRQAFVPISAEIKQQPLDDQAYIKFLDLVSPKRKANEKMDKLAVQRLQARPFGFANALAAVSIYAKALDEHKLNDLIQAIPNGVGIIGGLSNPGLIQAQERIQQNHLLAGKQWRIEVLPQVDHSLVYVRPKKIAQIINRWLV